MFVASRINAEMIPAYVSIREGLSSI